MPACLLASKLLLLRLHKYSKTFRTGASTSPSAYERKRSGGNEGESVNVGVQGQSVNSGFHDLNATRLWPGTLLSHTRTLHSHTSAAHTLTSHILTRHTVNPREWHQNHTQSLQARCLCFERVGDFALKLDVLKLVWGRVQVFGFRLHAMIAKYRSCLQTKASIPGLRAQGSGVGGLWAQGLELRGETEGLRSQSQGSKPHLNP